MSSVLLPGLALAAALAPAEVQTFRYHADHVVGTSFDMSVAAAGEADARVAFTAARAEIARLDKILSGWRADSELSALNASDSLQVSPDLFAVIAACEDWRARTGGAFDARFGEGCAQTPTLDAATRTITRPAGLRFDVDGLAKGYVIDAALAAARKASPCISAAMVDLGGDVGCWGERAWILGVANPAELQDNAPPAAMIRVSNQALAVSGPGLRDTVVDGEARSHLIDRATETSAPRRQAAVLAASAMDADALSTALAVLPTRRGLELAQSIPGVEALLFDIAGAPSATTGWNSCQAAALPAGFVVNVGYEIPKIEAGNYKRPFVIVWVTDAEKSLVKTLLISGTRAEWQEDNYVFWRRYGRKLPGVVEAMGKPTRAPGKYSVGWDGTDNDGKRVPQGRYIVHIEAAREHGGHAYQTIEVDLAAKPANGAAVGKDELGAAQVRYAKGK